jgi:hypothetical protein
MVVPCIVNIRLNTEGEKEQRIKNVKNTQPFVIDGGHPFVEFLHERAVAHLGLGPRD